MSMNGTQQTGDNSSSRETDEGDESLRVAQKWSSHDYAQAVATYARRSRSNALFSGELFNELSALLCREIDMPKTEQSTDIDVVASNQLASGAASSHSYSNIAMLLRLTSDVPALHDAKNNHSALIFLRGHQPAECLNYIGATCAIDPLLFQRHLRTRWSSRPHQLFTEPAILSASTLVLRLKLVSVGELLHVNAPATTIDLHGTRELAEISMEGYAHNLSREFGLRAGDSVVQRYNVHTARYFSIEQNMSISLQKRPSSWFAVIWTDAGRSLASGPSGPWKLTKRSKRLPSMRFLPTVQYDAESWDRSLQTTLPATSLDNLAQSASILPLQYGSKLDLQKMRCSPFYALSELYTFAANSVAQLLNLIEHVVEQNIRYRSSKTQRYDDDDLMYHRDILRRIEDDLRGSLHDLERVLTFSATVEKPSDDFSSEKNKLVGDFEELLFRATTLSVRCRDGITICMNHAAIEESKRAIAQAKQIERLSRLAFFYIPLSFTTSFFGMNLGKVGTGTLPLWIWFVISIVVLSLSYLILILSSSEFVSNLVLKFRTMKTKR